ncbi:MAG: hypothetical protein R3D29_07365 [Nitratireductor sp.]
MAQDKLPTTGSKSRLATAPERGGAVGISSSVLGSLTTASGRLICTLDATLSRQPAWDMAMQYQASMFDAVSKSA